MTFRANSPRLIQAQQLTLGFKFDAAIDALSTGVALVESENDDFFAGDAKAWLCMSFVYGEQYEKAEQYLERMPDDTKFWSDGGGYWDKSAIRRYIAEH